MLAYRWQGRIKGSSEPLDHLSSDWNIEPETFAQRMRQLSQSMKSSRRLCFCCDFSM